MYWGLLELGKGKMRWDGGRQGGGEAGRDSSADGVEEGSAELLVKVRVPPAEGGSSLSAGLRKEWRLARREDGPDGAGWL